jgi:hypothetical protein
MAQQKANSDSFEPLFNNAHSALVFAFNFSGQSFDRPMMNRLAAPAVGTGKGLVGLDGAAQAGFIRSEVQRLGRLAEAILIARIAPSSTPCSCRSICCSGHKPNKEWADAISYLADQVRTTALAGCTANGMMRREYVIRYFTPKNKRRMLDSMAKKFDIDRNTASTHNSKVSSWLGGVPSKNGNSAIIGMEELARNAIESRLIEIGMVG